MLYFLNISCYWAKTARPILQSNSNSLKRIMICLVVYENSVPLYQPIFYNLLWESTMFINSENQIFFLKLCLFTN